MTGETFLTAYIIRNIRTLIRESNQYALQSPQFYKPFMNYNPFLRNRQRWLKANENYVKLFKNLDFLRALRTILADFKMNQRGSQLTPQSQLQATLLEAGPDFDLLSSEKIRLATLNLRQKIGDETIDSIIRRIYELFDDTNRLSESGGIVIASKTMHMIMPEVFIMIDNRVMKALHNISDYHPHLDEGDWYDVLTGYPGYKSFLGRNKVKILIRKHFNLGVDFILEP